MRLTKTFIPEPENYRVSRPDFQPEEFKKLCQELGFVSILKDFDGWTRVFAERAEQGSNLSIF
jgi:hypothetical protein